jgi:hypothetical protein
MDSVGPIAKWSTALFLAVTWLSCSAATLWFAAQTSAAVPKFDEWPLMVPALCGRAVMDAGWFWGQLNEHRVPLPRLAYLLAFYASGGDFRSGAFLTVGLLSAVSLAAMIVMGRMRGRSYPWDAFFPLMLLHWGQAHTFLLGVLLNFGLTMAFFYASLFIALGADREIAPGRALLLTLCLAGMIGSGLTGLILAVPMIVWMVAQGIRSLRGSAGNRTAGVKLLLLGISLAVFIVFYFRGWQRPQIPAAAHGPGGPAALVKNVGTLVAMSLGWLGKVNWVAAAVLILAIGLAVAYVSWRRFRSGTDDQRFHSQVIMVFGSSVVLIIGSLAWGRSFMGSEGLWATTRYATLSIPLLVILYCATGFMFSRPWRGACQAALFFVAAAVFIGHWSARVGYTNDLGFAQWVRSHEQELLRELKEKGPSEEVAGHFFAQENNYSPVEGAAWLHMLRLNRLGPFADCLANPVMLDLAKPGAEQYLSQGWSAFAEPFGRWTDGRWASIKVPARTTSTHWLTIQMIGFLVPGRIDRQRVAVLANGQRVGSVAIDKPGWQDFTVQLPQAIGGDLKEIELELPDAMAPCAAAYNNDTRQLGVLVRRLGLD